MPNLRQFAKTLLAQEFPFRFLTGLVLYRSGICRSFKIHHPDFVIPFRRHSHALTLWANPHSNEEDFAFLRTYLRPGDLVIDVGANIGLLTLSASRAIGDSGRVLAVEPHPRTFEGLVANVAANGRTNVTPRNVALGAREGALRFEDRKDDTMNRVLDGEDPGGIEVRVSRLDDLVGQVGFASGRPIALLKIDAEGYERFVIEGATDTLARTRCVYFEAGDILTAPFGYTASVIFELLKGRGFSILKVEGAGRVSPWGGGDIIYGNFFAVRDEGEFLKLTHYRISHRPARVAGDVGVAPLYERGAIAAEFDHSAVPTLGATHAEEAP